MLAQLERSEEMKQSDATKLLFPSPVAFLLLTLACRLCFLVTKRRCKEGLVVAVTLGMWGKILMYAETISVTPTTWSEG
jgi:hypothetical protein